MTVYRLLAKRSKVLAIQVFQNREGAEKFAAYVTPDWRDTFEVIEMQGKEPNNS